MLASGCFGGCKYLIGMRILLLLCGLLCAEALLAQLNLNFTPLDSTFTKSLGLVSRGDDSDDLYILEKDGLVFRYNTETHVKDTFLDLSQRLITTGEGGLLSGTFDPQLDSNHFFILYTVPGDSPEHPVNIQLSRFDLNEDGLADTTKERIILAVEKPDISQNGGGLAFGPDNYLYIGTGDGGGRLDVYENGQNPLSLLGKLLRIDVRAAPEGRNYSIPPDNPFVGSLDTLDEIWSLGVRNPFHISFDSENGDLWIGDKADTYWQEINYQPAGSGGGQNYGWNCREGFAEFEPSSPRFCGSDSISYDAPLLVYGKEGEGGFKGGSVTGGEVYHGPEAELQGLYIFGDFFAQRLFLYRPGDPVEDSVKVVEEVPFSNLTTFGTGNDGSLYAVGYAGSIYRIEMTKPEKPSSLVSPLDLTLEVYPNPVSDHINLSLPTSLTGAVRVSLMDAVGRRAYAWPQTTVGANALQLPLPALSPGVYTLLVDSGSYMGTVRLAIH